MNRARLDTDVLTAAGRSLARAKACGSWDQWRSLAGVYQRLRFVQIEDFVAGDLLETIMRDLMPEGRKHTVRILRPHEVSTGSLREGRRFGRIDPAPFAGGELEPEGQAAVRAAFDSSGLSGFVSGLLAETLPLVEEITGHK